MHWETIIIIIGAIIALSSIIALYIFDVKKSATQPFSLNHNASTLYGACDCKDPQQWQALKVCFFEEVGNDTIFTEAQMLEHFVNIALSDLPKQDKREAITASFEAILTIVETQYSLRTEAQA